jgi:hypothetical protein
VTGHVRSAVLWGTGPSAGGVEWPTIFPIIPEHKYSE